MDALYSMLMDVQAVRVTDPDCHKRQSGVQSGKVFDEDR